MKKDTKWLIGFGVTIGTIWSVAWSIQDGALNLWPLAGMLGLPMLVIAIVSLIKGKSQW